MPRIARITQLVQNIQFLRLRDVDQELWLPGGKDGGRDSQGVWDGHGHTTVFNMENQQGPAGQHRELCSVLCNNLMVPGGKDGGRDSQGVWDGHGHTAAFNIHNHLSTPGRAL